MNNDYNADMYLTPTDLNNIENKIEETTEKIRNKIYNNTSSSLRNIQVGDDLSGKTLYLSFPRDSYNNITNTTRTVVITVSSDKRIYYIYSNSKRYIAVSYKGTGYYIYAKNDNVINPYLNSIRFKLPNDFGVVTAVDNQDTFYQYVKIYNNENIIPNYVKKQWETNEIPYIQHIDNIEQGVENIGKYCAKPLGWSTTRNWIKTSSIEDRSDYGVGNKGFSYRDINRWINNLNLIDNVDMENGTFWNTNKTKYHWE